MLPGGGGGHLWGRGRGWACSGAVVRTLVWRGGNILSKPSATIGWRVAYACRQFWQKVPARLREIALPRPSKLHLNILARHSLFRDLMFTDLLFQNGGKNNKQLWGVEARGAGTVVRTLLRKVGNM